MRPSSSKVLRRSVCVSVRSASSFRDNDCGVARATCRNLRGHRQPYVADGRVRPPSCGPVGYPWRADGMRVRRG
jgi:hypothetical protein